MGKIFEDLNNTQYSSPGFYVELSNLNIKLKEFSKANFRNCHMLIGSNASDFWGSHF